MNRFRKKDLDGRLPGKFRRQKGGRGNNSRFLRNPPPPGNGPNFDPYGLVDWTINWEDATYGDWGGCGVDCTGNYCCAGDTGCLWYWDCGCCGSCATYPVCHWNSGTDYCGNCGGDNSSCVDWCGVPCCNCNGDLDQYQMGYCEGVPGCCGS